MFRQHKDVERIAVTAADLNVGSAPDKISDAASAKCSRNKSIVCRNDIRILLRTVDLQVTCFFVRLVLNGVSRNDLDKDSYLRGRILAYPNPMPRVRFVGAKHTAYYLARYPKCLTPSPSRKSRRR